MNKIKTLLLTVCAATAMLFTANSAIAQGDYTDEQIDQYVAIIKDVMPAQKAMQEKMAEAVKAKGMTMERFQEMAVAMQSGDETMGDATEEEQANFMEVAQSMMSLQQDIMMKMGEAAEKHGMDMTTFQQMSMAYAQDPEMKSKIDGMLGLGDGSDNMDEEAEGDEG